MRRIFVFGMLLTIPFAPIIIVGMAQDCPNNVPHVTGTWTTLPYQMPLNPISATLLHTGKVLIVAGSENDASNNSAGSESYRAATWDPTGATESSIEVQEVYYDVFCSGTAVLPHGRPLIIGGSSDYSFKGDKRASFFDPATSRFVQSQSMADGRWYGTATALPDGRVMAFSGLGLSGSTNTTVQIYDLTNNGAGWGSTVNDGFTPPLFPRTFLLPDGRLFFTAQGSGSPAAHAYFFDPVGKTWTTSIAPTSNRQYGAAVLLPLYPPSYAPKIINFGGGDPGTMTTELIQPLAGTPAWTPGPVMSANRIQMNAVILPNGTVLAEGGSQNNESPDTLGKSADLYVPDAGTGTITSAGFASYSRLYHSTSVLLPDATVAVMGSNPGGRGSYESAIEIYTPAYLFDANDQPIVANRPAITGSSPGIYGYGTSFTVNYTSTNPIATAVLVRPGSSTHASDMEQRLVGLCGASPQPACSGSAGTLTLTTPANGNVAPPGFYMLFLVDSAGVPSKAQFIELSQYTTTPPSGSIATPAADVTITAGGSVNFTSGTTASKYSWIFPGTSTATSTMKNPGNVTFATAGTYTASLTVLDASGNSDPSPPARIITVLPTAKDFDIDVDPPVYEVHPGGTATFTVTVTPKSGFTSTVSLGVGSESGFPLGVTLGSFNPPTIAGGGSSTLTMNTTTAAVPYALSLTITGTSGSLSHTSSTTLLMTLAPPQGLVATPTDSQVALSWQPSLGASSYQLGRSLVSGGPYDSIGCPTGTSLTDTGLTDGTTYYYAVSAKFTGGPDAGGASALSSEVLAMPPCPVPGYSGALSAGKSGGNTSWSWTAGGAFAFDVVRGDLGTLRSTGGDFTSALAALPGTEAACLANDSTALSVTDSDVPSAGAGVFALLRAVATSCPAHGSYDDGSASLAASRDGGIVASSRSCP